jgi:hypothetical protein
VEEFGMTTGLGVEKGEGSSGDSHECFSDKMTIESPLLQYQILIFNDYISLLSLV